MRKGPYRETRSVMQVSTRRGGRHFAGRGVAGWWKVAFAIVLTAAMVLQSSNIQAIAGELLDPAGAGQVAGGEVEQQVADESVAEGLTEADGADETDAAAETDSATETDATVEADGEQTAAGDVTEGDDVVADGTAAEGEPSEDVTAEPVDETVTEESTTPETQAETVASESASADGVEGRTIYGPNTVAVGETIRLSSNKGDWFARNWWTSSNSNCATVSGDGQQATVAGVREGSVIITHNWSRGILGSGSETFEVTVTASKLYVYTLVPGYDFEADVDANTKWNGMGIGTISGLDSARNYKVDEIIYRADEIPLSSINLPEFPDITVGDTTYKYAAEGSPEAAQAGHYTITWQRVKVANGANAGANGGISPTVSPEINTYHLDGFVTLIDEDQVQVSFRVKQPNATEFDEPLVAYNVMYDKGTPAGSIQRPNDDDVTPEKEVDGKSYIFMRWYTDEDCTVEAKFGDNLLTENTTYYGQYVLNEDTLRYEPNGGTGSSYSVTDIINGTVTVAGNTFTAPTGYTFASWNTQANGQGKSYAAGDEYTLTDGVDVLYAQWEIDAQATASVKYEATAGGSVTNDADAVQVVTAEGLEGSTAMANPGYKFDGWFVDETPVTTVDADGSDGYTLTAEEAKAALNRADNETYAATEFTAKFSIDTSEASKVDVTYTAVNGTVDNESDRIQIVTAEGLEGSTAAADTGYKFDGWFKDGAEQPFTEDETLTAEVAKANLNTEKNGTYAATTFTARFSVDDGQTKDLSATVDYALSGVVQVDERVDLKDTVQVLEPDTLSTAGVTAKEFAGWTLDSITINGVEVASLDATVNNGDEIVYHYVADTSALSVSNYSGVYDGESHGIAVNGLIEGDVVSYSVSNSFTDVTGSPVSVTATVTRNGVAIWSGTATVSITPATIRVTISDATKVEGQVDPGLESTYVVPVAGELAGFEGSIAREPGEEPGTYVIGRGTLALVDRAAQAVGEKDFKASNYTLEVVPGTFTITAAPGGGDNPGGGTDTPDNPGGGGGTDNPGGGAGGTNPGGTGTGAGTGTGTGAGTNPAPTPVTATADDDAAADDEAIDDDENPLADDASADDESDDAESIDDDSNPLASGTGSTAETCWVHWAVIVGIIVTVAYFAVCAARTRRATDELASFEDDVLDRR